MVIARKRRANSKVVCVNGKWTITRIKQRTQVETSNVDDEAVLSEILSCDKIEKAVKALLDLKNATTAQRQSLFENEGEAIFLQIACVKIPHTPDRILRLNLPYSLKTDTADVCLFVPDLLKGTKEDHEPTIEHYQGLLQKHGVTDITQIIPLRQLRTEYYQYELRRRLCHSFDFFLAEGKICGRLTPLLGKEFHSKRKAPTPINLHSKNLKGEIEKALRKMPLYITSKGDSTIVQVAHTNLGAKEIIENVITSIEALKTVYPGGLKNIKSLQIKTARSMSIPVYLNLRTANAVKPTVERSRKPKASKSVSGELSTLPGAHVTVLPNGDVIVKRVKDDNLTDESESEATEGKSEGNLTIPKNSKKKQSKEMAKEESENDDNGVEAAEDAYLAEWLKTKIDSKEVEGGEPKLKKCKHDVKGKEKKRKDESLNSKVKRSKPKRKKILNVKPKGCQEQTF